MAGPQSVNDVLRRLHGLFRSCLNFQSISPQLRQHNLLTDHEWQVIKSKDSHEDQVDEFLNYLPFKGKDCLNQLIECLRSSLDHLGHQDILTELEAELIKRVDHDNFEDQTEEDEFKKAVSTIDRLYMDQKELVLDMQTKLQEKEKEISTMKTELVENKNEISAMKVKLDEKDAENIEFSVQLSTKDTELENLRRQLREMEDTYLHAPVQETESTDDELIQDEQDPETAPNISINVKMKQYKRKLDSYRKKYRFLEKEKVQLIQIKMELEDEIDELKKGLDLEPGNRSSYSSRNSHRRRSASCSNLELITNNYQEEKRHEDVKSPAVRQSKFATLTSYFSAKGITKRTRFLSEGPGDLEDSIRPISPFMIPENIHEDEYINPLHQGWLLKEGGKKKHWKKRWCVLLSSKYFCYFEGKDDPAKKKRPIGIVPITEEMEVVDSLKEDIIQLTTYKLLVMTKR
ncbi:putative leucine-rich repeat-containing protein DDB_G0290503 isoform X2 [Dysidea avara]|uniref:putative leucine-rich repeat-containing protein DDB_G0290503 isoform X2 n=1 Tax=Dysidea avara TaxID=196820 RepID=UPI00332AD7BE